MKKLMVLLLCATLCLSLAACGSSSDEQTGKPQTVIEQMKENMAATEDCVAVIRLQINPAFDLYLDENDRVLAIACLNNDAKQLLGNTDVIGHHGMDVIVMIVSAVFERGMVKEEVSIYLTPVCQEGNTTANQLIEEVPQAIESLKADRQLDVAVSVAVDEDGVVAGVSADPDDGNDSSQADWQQVPLTGNETEVEKDGNGNIVKTVEILDTGDVQAHYYDEKGRLTQIVIDYADGSHYESLFSDGKLSQSTRTDVHGTLTQTTYNADGVPVLTTGTTADGGALEWTHYANGEVKDAVVRYADGAYNKQSFDEAGIKLSEESAYVRVDGVLTESKIFYDASGNRTEYYGRDNFDRPVHVVYHADGSSTTEVTESDGSVRIVRHDASGNEIH